MISGRRADTDGDLRRIYFQLELLDGSEALAEAGEQPQISVNGAAWGNTTNLLVAMGNARYYVELTQAEYDLKDGSVIESRYNRAGVTFEASGTTIQITEATNKEIYDRFDEIVPKINFMDANSVVNDGAVVSGTYLLTQIEDGQYWITEPDAVDGLEQILEFDIGTSQVPALLEITGYFRTIPPTGFADVDFYDHELLDWVQVSDVDTRMDSENANLDYIYVPKSSYVDPVTGLVLVRLRSASTGANDRMNLDKVVLTSFASGSAGLTPGNIAAAVWNYKPGDVHDHETTAFWLRTATLAQGSVLAVTDAQNFQLDGLEAAANVHRGALIYIHDEVGDLYYKGVIESNDALGNVVLADPLAYLPQIGDGFAVFPYGFNPAFESVDVGTIGGAPVAGSVITGIFQSKVTIDDGRDRIVFTGDSPTLELVAPEGWDFTGKRVWFATAIEPGDPKKIDEEATVTGVNTAEVQLLATDLDVVETYEAEFKQTDADGVSKVLTIARFRLAVRKDI